MAKHVNRRDAPGTPEWLDDRLRLAVRALTLAGVAVEPDVVIRAVGLELHPAQEHYAGRIRALAELEGGQ